ncbi:hypothetical protein DNTS_004687 [Danionella cerebrum]|uniref:AAA+ ATPase domain-containing protein n=1 Tax=Danionella cerebrum TaxID=2873325 RepID=A0A553QYL0_9TELE|nr:hypothetical protein DNTS_004687 [Danionella translucida]
MEKCFWCTTSLDLDGEASLTKMLHQYCSGQLSQTKRATLNEDLSFCLECVVEYHRAREKVPELHECLWEIEIARLLRVLESILEHELEEDDIFIVEDDHIEPVSKISPNEFHYCLRCPLFEVLKYPYLLCFRELCDLVVKALCKLQEMKRPLIVFEKYQGTYLLLVHPNEQVRRWAIDAAKTMKSVDRDAFYDLQEIFTCMFSVTEMGISLDSPDLDPINYAGGAVLKLPSHLFDAENKKNYWLGICMLLTQLNAEAMDSLFMAPFNIPQCILNTMDSLKNEDDLASDPFWPALQCFMVILDQLGSKIWAQVDPNVAFQTITGAASYNMELRLIQQKTMGRRVKVEPEDDDNIVSCSQAVYNCYTSEKQSRAPVSSGSSGSNCVIYEDMQSLVSVLDSEMGRSMRVYGSTFLWFIPFVRSIMELPELNASYISEVIHYLCDKLRDNRHMLTGQTSECDKVTEFFARILVQIIELHSTEHRMGILSRCAHKWVEVMVMCAVLSDEPLGPPDKTGEIHGVSSTSFSLGMVGRPEGGSGAVIQGCLTIIRLLLKEGIRRADPDAATFLNLLNKQLRGFANQRWSLQSSDSAKLQRCLMRIVRLMPERPVSPSCVAPPSADATTNADLCRNPAPNLMNQQDYQEAGPSNTASLKKEPQWNYKSSSFIEDSYNDLERVIMKKEPSDPVCVSEPGPATVGVNVKPDIDKLKEIRSRLNNDQSFLRIVAVAGSQPCETSGPVQLASAENRQVFKAIEENNNDDDEDDDEPLDRKLKRLKNSSINKFEATNSDSRSVGISKDLESSVIVISDDESLDDEILEETLPSSGTVRNKSPETPEIDMDDFCESQIFECDTQQYVASAWNDADFDAFTKTMKSDRIVKPHLSKAPPDASPPWSADTQPIPDSDKERARQQAEEKLQQQEPVDPCSSSSLAKSNTAENRDKFVTPKPQQDKATVSKQKEHQMSKKPMIIDALALKIKRHPWKRNSVSEDVEEPSSSMTTPSSDVSSSSSSTSSAYFSFSRSRGKPAIVPPKKVRKVSEPESTVERLGLKKKERKAFDLSQRSLDSVAQLRCHGQNVHVEPLSRQRRVSHTSRTSPKKRKKKLMASQDFQFFRQSREKNQRQAAIPILISNPVDHNDELLSFKTNSASKEAGVGAPVNRSSYQHQQDHEKSAAESNDKVIQSKYFHVTEPAKVTTEVKDSSPESKNEEEWMFLTQREPTDMELCSVLDGENEFFLTQRDPVDMELDSGSEMDTTEQPELTNVALTTPSARNNDHLFLKPGVSHASEKKSKPSTAKLYNPRSRSASLVHEMEKGAKPPPPANVAKAKIPKAPRSLPPREMAAPKSFQPLHPPQFSKPPPLKPTGLPVSSLARSIPSVKTNSMVVHSTCKVYARPETPVNVHASTKDQTTRFDPSLLTQTMLNWDFKLLENYKSFGSPLDLCHLPLKEVPVQFSCYQEYFNVLYPLLLHNAFEEVANEWLKEGRLKMFLKFQSVEYSNRTAAGLNQESEMKQLYPKEDDLVLLWLPDNSGAYVEDKRNVIDTHPHFGYVSRAMVSNRGQGSGCTLNLTIQTRGNVSSVNLQPVKCEVIGSMISVLREFRALCLLRNGPMQRPLLAPNASYFTHSLGVPSDLDTADFNRDQARAIASGLSMVRTPHKTPKFLLIHGPPGTGKSQTIAGLLYQLLSTCTNSSAPVGNSKARRTRVLLCAPSNAAIDSLMKKVILTFKNKCKNKNSPQGNCGDIHLVRLGSERTISKTLKPFSLDNQTKIRAQRAQQSVEADIHRRKEQLDQTIENLTQRCAKTMKNSPEFTSLIEQKKSLLKEREGLSRQIKEFRSKRHETQAVVLQNAHVICSTLSTSGSIVLENAFRRLGHEPFSCVIIDEASQAKETETLIPLLYRCQNLILVGDPNQLPPTVISQKAKECGYDQSLMARLCKNLHLSNPQLSPILLLGVQYRMHPDICAFPSKHIYNSALQSDCETARIRCSATWPFKPYKVFDVKDGREARDGDSFINPREVTLVVLLLKMLCKEQTVKVGVITPYNAQKQQILEAIWRSGINKQLQVDVDTVDGFQGREVDCVIVSCVRASSEMGSIGFVGNRQRMNVTITRARFSLFILGHLRTLREQRDWGALIEDAERRECIISTAQKHFEKDVKKIVKSKPNPLMRSLSHPSAEKPSTATMPAAPVSGQPMPKLIPLDCPKDPQTSGRPRDPRFSERRASSEQSEHWRPSHSLQRANSHDSTDSLKHREFSQRHKR